ncbi:MAG: TonB-dependent receptor, partial [Bacteroidales bacterium]|nr:TonB-dependent receptor [Bacteroidales bacterium]
DNVRVMYFGENRGSGHIAGLDMKIFGELVPGVDSWVSFSLMDSRERFDGKGMPRPTDQRYNISMFFQDYFPKNPKYKLQLKLVWADGLPFGPSGDEANKAAFRMSPYRRVDIGMSRQLVGGEDRVMRRKIMRHLKNVWLGIDVFNLFNISNVNSYYWITDVHNQQYAVPNYLTSRQINLRLVADF